MALVKLPLNDSDFHRLIGQPSLVMAKLTDFPVLPGGLELSQNNPSVYTVMALSVCPAAGTEVLCSQIPRGKAVQTSIAILFRLEILLNSADCS